MATKQLRDFGVVKFQWTDPSVPLERQMRVERLIYTHIYTEAQYGIQLKPSTSIVEGKLVVRRTNGKAYTWKATLLGKEIPCVIYFIYPPEKCMLVNASPLIYAWNWRTNNMEWFSPENFSLNYPSSVTTVRHLSYYPPGTVIRRYNWRLNSKRGGFIRGLEPIPTEWVLEVIPSDTYLYTREVRIIV